MTAVWTSESKGEACYSHGLPYRRNANEPHSLTAIAAYCSPVSNMSPMKHPLPKDSDDEHNASLLPLTDKGHISKYTQYDYQYTQPKTMRSLTWCRRPSHQPMYFKDPAEYDAHVIEIHSHDCPEPKCRKSFPDSRLLSLHHSEHHDPIVAAKRERGDKTYGCLVEGCDRVCANWGKRKMHLMARHHYPKNYDFKIVETGLLAGRNSVLRWGVDAKGHRKSSRENLWDASSSPPAATLPDASDAPDSSSASASQDAAVASPSSKSSDGPGGSAGVVGESSDYAHGKPVANSTQVNLTGANSTADHAQLPGQSSNTESSPFQLRGRMSAYFKAPSKALGEEVMISKPAHQARTERKAVRKTASQPADGKGADKSVTIGEVNGKTEETTAMDIDDLAASMSALRFVPRSVKVKRKANAKARAKDSEAEMDMSSGDGYCLEAVSRDVAC